MSDRAQQHAMQCIICMWHKAHHMRLPTSISSFRLHSGYQIHLTANSTRPTLNSNIYIYNRKTTLNSNMLTQIESANNKVYYILQPNAKSCGRKRSRDGCNFSLSPWIYHVSWTAGDRSEVAGDCPSCMSMSMSCTVPYVVSPPIPVSLALCVSCCCIVL